MAFNLVYTRSSVRDIKKFDRVVKKKIKKKIEIYSKSPKKNARLLINSRIGSCRWRVGNYRIVFDIVGKDIVILRIRHRKDVYK
ncbi:type II toxin-antitoxin system RelE/ParE family toxin [Patescibacteria group bacterium]|nr:type II toxin-antitoxin system RelE/ParE family toxin [Patescibacteria group bacterium]